MNDLIDISNVLVLVVILAGLEQVYETFVLGQRKEKGELRGERWTIFGMGIIHASMFFATLTEHFVTNRSINLVVSFMGLLVYGLGIFFRYWSIYTLGKFWSIHIEIRARHELIREGPYKFMRHPAYFALFLKVPSIPLILNSYHTFFVVLLTYCPLVFIRLYYEEVELFKQFRKLYVKYRRGKWALLPFSKGKRLQFIANNLKYFKKTLTRW